MRWRRRGKIGSLSVRWYSNFIIWSVVNRIRILEDLLIWKIAPPNFRYGLLKKPSSLSRNASVVSQSHPLFHQQQKYYQQISKSKRSKSMDDFTTQLLVEQSSRVQRNNTRNGTSYHNSSASSHIGRRSPANAALLKSNNFCPPQLQHKNHLRYSVDNLLAIDTSYYNNYQVKNWMQANDIDNTYEINSS